MEKATEKSLSGSAMIQRTNYQKNGMEIRKPAMLMIRQETGFKRKKKVNSTATSTAPGTNWYPWRKAGKPDITSMINRAIKIPADIRCQLPGFDKLYHYTDEGR